MRLTEGYFRVWLEDVDRLFSQSPKDFAMFYYLLANCHYKDDPFETTIKGNTQKKEIYNQKWLIQKGDYFGSKHQIRSFWKFDIRTQKTIFASMAEKGLIEILLEDPALILRIKNYNHFAWRGKSKERPAIPLSGGCSSTQGGCSSTQGGCSSTQGGVENYIGGGVILHEVDTTSMKKNIEVEENYTQSHLHSSTPSISLITSSEVCGEKPAGNSHTNLSESKIYTFQKEENEPSTEELDTAYEWHRQIVKTFPKSIFDVLTLGSFVRRANKIIQILNPTIGDISILLGFVATKGNTYLTSMFFQKPPEIFEVDKYGTTPLEEACRKLEDHFKLENEKRRKRN